MSRLRLSLILVFSMVLSVGCENTPTPEPTFTVRDSAGIEIVESSAPMLSPDEAWTISEEPVLQIGEVEGEDPYLFAWIRGQEASEGRKIFRMADGRILVCNGMDRTVRIFSGQGEFLQQLGGQGEGPGEFSAIGSCGPLEDGFFVRQSRSVSFFDSDGVLLETSKPSSISNPSLFRLRGVFADRSLLVSEYTGDRPKGGPGVNETVFEIFLLSPDGQQSDWRFSINAFNVVGDFGYFGRQAFSPLGQVVAANEGIFYGWGDEYEILRYDLGGNLARSVRRDWTHIPVTEQDREWWDSTYVSYERLRGRDSPSDVRRFKQGVDEMVWPDFKPVFDRLIQDRLGHLWVRNHHPKWHSRWGYSHRFPYERTWDIFDPDGRWVTSLPAPKELEIQDIGEDYILGVWKDEMDVEYVRMYSLDRGG